MIRGSQFGNDYTIKDYKPTYYDNIREYNPSYTDYKPQTKDPLKLSQYKSNNLDLNNNTHEHKPNKPGAHNMYDEKEKQKFSPRKQKPEPKQLMNQNTLRQRKVKTFKCYQNDTGPNIKVKNTGPDYPIKEYKYTDPDVLKRPNKVKPPEPYRPRAPFQFENKHVLENKYVDYKLTEKNNLGMRHFHNDFVDDTVRFRASEGPKYKTVLVPKTPEQKPMAAVKPVSKKPKSPVEARKVPYVAAVVAPPPKKKFVNSSTQHVTPGNKSSQTQTQTAPVKNTTIQTDTPNPVPQVAAVGAVMAPSHNKIPSKSKSVQATEPQKKVTAAGTQYTGPATKQATMQTSPIIFATQSPRRVPSPEYARAVPVQESRRSPEPIIYRRSPSPQAAPRMDTPRNQNYTPPRPSSGSRWSPTPVVPVVIPTRRATPPRREYTPPHAASPPRARTPPHQETLHRVTTPPRFQTPPHLETPPPIESPPGWQSPMYHLTPEPQSERVFSPPNAVAPVIVPMPGTTPGNQPSYVPTNYSPVNRSPSSVVRSPPPAMAPVVVPTTYSPNQAETAATRFQAYARAPPAQKPDSPNVPRRLSPVIPSQTNAKETAYPQSARTKTPPHAQQPYFNPQRAESTKIRSPPISNHNVKSYAPNKNGRLPPEVNACIEAYDNAHTADPRRSGSTLSSMRRTMRYM